MLWLHSCVERVFFLTGGVLKRVSNLCLLWPPDKKLNFIFWQVPAARFQNRGVPSHHAQNVLH